MKMKFRITETIFFIFILLLHIGCSRRNVPVEFAPMKMEELDPRTQWIVVVDPYVACRQEPSYEADVSYSLRKGGIYCMEGVSTVVTGDKKDSITEKWYAINGGWVPESAVKVFSNKLKAEQFLKSNN